MKPGLALLLAICALAPELFAQKEVEQRLKRPQTVNVIPGQAAEPVTIETVNRRWKGAQAQIRLELLVEKGKDKNGWSSTKVIDAPRLPGEGQYKFSLAVSNRALLEEKGFLYRRLALRPGTMFIASQWTFLDPKKQRGLILRMKFPDLPVEAVMSFPNTKIDDLEDVERVARIELFQLTQPQTPQPAPQTISAVPPVPSTPTAHDPVVRVLAASVNPPQAARGSQIELIVLYEVQDLPAGAAFPVMETRRLKSGDRVLGNFEQPVSRAAGSFTSKQTIEVPSSMAPGVYRFEVDVTLAGKKATGAALFEVR